LAGDRPRRSPRGYDAIHDNVATKADPRELEKRLELRFEKLELQIDRMVSRLAALAAALTSHAGRGSEFSS
jgi:hypothetical protein